MVADVIDLRRFTGIPGLIDVHTHMTYWSDPAAKGPPHKNPDPKPAEIRKAAPNARKTLETGVTTVRDLAGTDFADIAMRAALVPDTPPPMITTFAAGTPGTPPSSMPEPPCSFSRQWAPT